MKAAFDKASNRDVTLLEEMNQKNKWRKKTMELLKQERINLEKQQSLPETLEANIVDYAKREETLATEKAKLEEEKVRLLTALQEETKDLRASKEKLQTKLIDISKEVSATKSEFSLAENELKICRSDEVNQRTKLEKIKEWYATNEKTLAEHTRTFGELKNKIPSTERSLTDAQKELHAVKQEEAVVINEIRKNRIRIETTTESMRASSSKNRVLSALLQQKQQGNCPGLFGRLGDLGAIDKRYDVAVSTACGPLDNVVVDTVETAQWCIEFLKKRDIGRATFIALNMQEHLREIAAQPLNT